MFGNIGAGEMIFIVAVLLLVFGAKRLPEIGGSLGKGIREFKKSMNDIQSELSKPDNAAAQQIPAAQPAPVQITQAQQAQPVAPKDQ